MLYNRIKSGRIFLLISGFFSFYYDFVGEADDPSPGAVNCPLLHAEMIRTAGVCHFGLSVFDLADISIIYGDHLVFGQGVGCL